MVTRRLIDDAAAVATVPLFMFFVWIALTMLGY